MSEDTHNHGADTKFLFGFFLGGILGAIIIFLVGTKEGKKTTKILEKILYLKQMQLKELYYYF